MKKKNTFKIQKQNSPINREERSCMHTSFDRKERNRGGKGEIPQFFF